MVNSVEFSKRLKRILDFYGISATVFSEKIDFNRSTISHLLSGRNKPSLEFVMKVIQTFPEVELYWLLNGKGSFPANQKKTINTPEPSQPVFEDNNDATVHKDAIKAENQKPTSQNDSEIERIVIFYTDGSFKAYKK